LKEEEAEEQGKTLTLTAAIPYWRSGRGGKEYEGKG